MDVNNEGGTDAGEQTSLRASETRDSDEAQGAYKNQHDIEVFVMPIGVVGVILGRPFHVHRVELKAGVFVLDGL